jgi:hypothetical protein
MAQTAQDVALGRAIKEVYPWAFHVRMDESRRVHAYETKTEMGNLGTGWVCEGMGNWARTAFVNELIKRIDLYDYITAQDWKTWGLELTP